MNAIGIKRGSAERPIGILIDFQTREVLRANAVGNERQYDTFERLLRKGVREIDAPAASIGRTDQIQRGFIIWSAEIQKALQQVRRPTESVAAAAKRCVLAGSK